MFKINPKSLVPFIIKSGIIIGVLVLGMVIGALVIKRPIINKNSSNESQNQYVAFIQEVRLLIKNNYWNKLEDEQLNNLFILATEKLTGKPQNIKATDNSSVDAMLTNIINDIEDKDKQKEFVTTLADAVLSNLEPFGRSRLYTAKLSQDLSNNVANKTDKDFYKDLGIDKSASASALAAAYKQETSELEKSGSSEAKIKLQEVKKAFEVLSDDANRKIYDLEGIEPTMEYKLLTPNIFYIHQTKFSPTTYDELKRVSEKLDPSKTTDTLIYDLRDNVGGAIDLLPYFLGPFIGQDQYAYQFFQQGNREDFKTKAGWLPGFVRFKKVVILINENSQSTAEIMASVLKKYHVGVLVGTTSKGWGTVEKVFPLSTQLDPAEKYSVFLVHSLTLREDGQPIQSKGVEPMVNINSSNWEQELLGYYNYQELVDEVKKLVGK